DAQNYLLSVADSAGRRATFAYISFNGARLCSSITTPDGQIYETHYNNAVASGGPHLETISGPSAVTNGPRVTRYMRYETTGNSAYLHTPSLRTSWAGDWRLAYGNFSFAFTFNVDGSVRSVAF